MKVLSLLLPSLILYSCASMAATGNVLQTNDFIFVNEGTFLVNPPKLKIIKIINLDATRHIIRAMKHVSTTYEKYCTQFQATSISKSLGNWILLSKLFWKNSGAQQFCKKHITDDSPR